MKLKSKITEFQNLKTTLASNSNTDPQVIDAIRDAIRVMETVQMAVNDLEWKINKCRSHGEIYDLGKMAGYEDALLLIKGTWEYNYD